MVLRNLHREIVLRNRAATLLRGFIRLNKAQFLRRNVLRQRSLLRIICRNRLVLRMINGLWLIDRITALRSLGENGLKSSG